MIVVVVLITKLNKNKKNIWQKISFVYNHIYILMISDYYLNDKKYCKLKEEIIDFYESVTKEKNIVKKNKECLKRKEFLLSFYWWELGKNIEENYKLIDLYVNNYYRLANNTVKVLEYLLVAIIFTFVILIVIL